MVYIFYGSLFQKCRSVRWRRYDFILLGADWSTILPYFFVSRDRVMKSIFASTI